LSIKRFCIRVAILVGFSALVAVTVNLLRPEPIAWVAEVPYEIYSDCPETAKESIALDVKDIERERDFYIDARGIEEYKAGHVPGAMLLTYDSLFPTSADKIKEVKQAANGWRIIVYGPGKIGKLLADDLFSQEAGTVYYLEGGLDAWKKAGLPLEN